MRKEITKEVLFDRMKNHKINVNVKLFTPSILILLFEQNCTYLIWEYDEDSEEHYNKIVDELNEFTRRHGLINLFTRPIRQIAVEYFLKHNGREYTYKSK